MFQWLGTQLGFEGLAGNKAGRGRWETDYEGLGFTSLYFILFFLINVFIYFLAALGLRCCAWAFSSCIERGLLFVVVHWLLIAVASLVEHRL